MAEEVEVEEIEENKGGNYGLPFGLCKKYGIALPPKATPKDAWEALKNRTGKSPEDFYRDLKSEVTQEIDKTENEIVSADKKLKEQKIKELNDKVDQSLKKFSTEYKNGLKEHIDKELDDYQRDIIFATIDKVKYTNGDGKFYPGQNSISIPDSKPNALDKELGMDFQGTTFYHEYGHYLAKIISDKDETMHAPIYRDFNASAKMQQILKEDSEFCLNKLAKEGGLASPYNPNRITRDFAETINNVVVEKSMAKVSSLYEPIMPKELMAFDKLVEYYKSWGNSTEYAINRANLDIEDYKKELKKYEQDKAFYEKNKSQIKKAKAQNARMSFLTDLVAGATKGRINPYYRQCSGHSDSYWKGTKTSIATLNGVEPWAEYFGFKMTKDEKGLAAFKEYLPKTFNEYEKIYKGLKDYV